MDSEMSFHDGESPWGWECLSFPPICAPPSHSVGFGKGLAGGRQAPLLRVEEGKDVFAGHEALLHVPQFQVVHGQHVLLLLLLGGRGKGTRERGACGCLIFPSSYADMPGHPEWKGCGQPPSSHPHTPVPDGSQASPCQRPYVLGRSRPPVWLLGLWIRF